MAAPAPPDDSGSAGGPRQDAMSVDDSAKAKLDDTEINSASPRAAQKVDLDLDDAPFLEEETPEPAPAAEPEAPSLEEDLTPVVLPWWKRKKIVIPGGGLLLVIIGLLVWWFLFRDHQQAQQETQPPPPQEQPKEPQAPPPPPEPAPPPPPKDIYQPLAPFVIEMDDAKGVTRVLTVTLKLVYKDESPVARELQLKSFAVRDGLYYNLKNKHFEILTDKQAVEALREELRGVVNNYLSTGQIDQVLFEELLVK